MRRGIVCIDEIGACFVMNVVIRADASTWIGSGHIMRCLVLADELVRLGFKVSFACIPQKGDMLEYIKTRGFRTIQLKPLLKPVTPVSDKDYLAWLQRPVIEDALDFADRVKRVDIVVTDHYAIDSSWQQTIRKKFNCKIIAIDDLARRHDADLVIDQTIGRTPLDYPECERVLAGSLYAIIPARFSRTREEALEKQECRTRPKVLVSMGGIDAPNATLKIVNALCENVEADFSVLLSSRAPHYNEVKQRCASLASVNHYEFVEDMAGFMLTHDLAIGAPGSTSWERGALGLPTVLVPIAANQEEICEKLVASNAAIAVRMEELDCKLVDAYYKIIEKWSVFRYSNFQICDGRGGRRVGLAIEHVSLPPSLMDLELVKATADDIKLVYMWQIDPKTRKYALNKSSPTWEEHYSWMSSKLASHCDMFYLAKDRTGGNAVGVLRLDRMRKGHYLVSIYVAPDCHGKGIGTKILEIANRVYPDVTLHATVLPENVASRNIFEKAKYKCASRSEFVRYPLV